MTTFRAPARALVRAVPDSYARCLRQDPVPVDPARARAQVEGYARALARHGVQVDRVDTDEACPDACFTEDVAVILDAERALITRPGAPSRRAEVEPVARALGARLELLRLDDAGACLDGGDVLRVGDALFVGLSGRTNRAGADGLARAARPLGLEVVPVPLAAGLHLKSVVTLVAPGLVVALEGAPLDELRARGARVLLTDEPWGANVLPLGPVVLVSTAAPRTLARLRREPGLECEALDVSELHKGDGALTCLSLRTPPPGGWCA